MQMLHSAVPGALLGAFKHRLARACALIAAQEDTQMLRVLCYAKPVRKAKQSVRQNPLNAMHVCQESLNFQLQPLPVTIARSGELHPRRNRRNAAPVLQDILLTSRVSWIVKRVLLAKVKSRLDEPSALIVKEARTVLG